jgi:RHS repeat-associated protein
MSTVVIISFKETFMMTQLRKNNGKSSKKNSTRKRVKFRPQVELLERRELLAAVLFDGGSGGEGTNWDVAENWAGDVLPGPNDDAIIGSQFAGRTIISSSDVRVNSVASDASLAISGGVFSTLSMSSVNNAFTLGGGTLNVVSELKVTGAMVWPGGVLTGTGRTLALGGMTMTGSQWFLDGHRLVSSGQTTITGTSNSNHVFFYNASTWTNALGATMDIQGNVNLKGEGSTFVNEGTLRTSAPTGSVAFNTVFNNSGTAEVLSGSLVLSAGGTTSANFVVSPQTELVFGGGTHDLTTSSVLGSAGTVRYANGTVNISGQHVVPNMLVTEGTANFTEDSTITLDTLTLDGGTANFGDAESLTLNTLALGFGTLNVGGELRITGAMTWSGGILSGTGRTLALGGMTMTGSQWFLDGHSLVSSGQTTITGTSNLNDVFFSNASTWTNALGATMDIQGNLNLKPYLGEGSTFVNEGTLRTSAPTGSVDFSTEFNNSGSVRIRQGNLSFTGGGNVAFDNSSYLASQTSSTFRLSTSLLGSTTNADLFSPQGTVIFTGGTSDAPRLLEVMSRDRDPISDQLQNNYRYRTLQLDSAYVRLTDASGNSPGTNAEAMFVDTLIVPSGSTLDLNALPLYARIVELHGVILNGDVQRISDGGPLSLNESASGRIEVAGEVDEWNFFGRAGQAITVIANPGTDGNPNPLAPTLDFVDVKIVDPNGTVVRSGKSNAAGEIVQLLGVQLSETGMHTIRIAAPTSRSDAHGNYVLSLWNSTANVSPIVMNQKVSGSLVTQYSVDRWTFTAVENQQIQFDFIAASSPDTRFKLSGPNGWTGFSGPGEDSALINLPETGVYNLEAFAIGIQGGDYSFQLRQTAQTDLTLGTTHTGTFAGSGQAQLFNVNIPEPDNLIVVLDDASNSNRNELYAKRGTPPTRSNFDYRFDAIASADQQIHASQVPAGDWYFLIYSESISQAGSYSLVATTEDVLITNINPQQHGDKQDALLTVSGMGFNSTSEVQLLSSEGTVYMGTLGEIISPTRITATFAAESVPPGIYTVLVTKEGGEPAIFTDAFAMVAGGDAVLETNLVLPAEVGRHGLATLYVEYANTGTLSMPAPLLTLSSSPATILTLDQSRVVEGFWTSAVPDGFSDTVQFLASGKTSGVLEPGESVRIPVYYAGQLQPWIEDKILFDLTVTTIDQPDLINWDELKEETRIESVSSEAWDALWLNMIEAVGTTWGDYVRMLDENAQYLAELGQMVTDVRDLWWFEIQQAYGFNQLALLESVVDTRLVTPGLPLTFDLYYSGCLLGRNDITSFGRGWFDSWDASLNVEQDGTVEVRTPRGFHRRFQPDARTVGKYFSQAGDQATLEMVSGNAFSLREADGIVTRYQSDGQLDFWEDTNGNRITAGYSGQRLSSLTHSSGQWLRFTYNDDNFIETISDSDGRTTTFGYDGELLTSIGKPNGQTTRFAYASSSNARIKYAISEVHRPTENLFYSYDTHGRLTKVTRDGGAVPLNIAYNSTGKVSTTDAAGATTEYFYDHRGEVAAVRDPFLSTKFFERDDDLQLTSITDTFGQVTEFIYDDNGNLIQTIDPIGNNRSFFYAGPFNRMVTANDANGITTQYRYDNAGNLVAIENVDESLEKFAYDPKGSLKATTNRRGETVNYVRDDAGRIIRKSYPDGSADEFVYDENNGNLVEIRDAIGITTLEYDSTVGDHLLTKIVYPGGRLLEFQYDAAGRRIQMTDQDDYQLKYSYNSLGRLKDLRDRSGAELASYSYDVAGRLSRKNLANRTYTTYEYDELDRLIRMVNHAPDGSTNSFFEYAYDDLLLRSSMSTKEGSWNYQFDAIGRLTSAVFQSNDPTQIPNQELAYEYDAMGNRVRTIRNGLTVDYESNDMNQYQTVGSATYRYDADGNLVRKVDGEEVTNFTYNVDNRLVEVRTSSDTWNYEYDTFGNRTASTHNGQRTEYVIDPFGYGDVVAEFRDTALISRFMYGVGGLTSRVEPDGTKYFYDTDEIGSVVGLTNAVGAYENSYVFDPFGELLSVDEALDNSFLFIGAHGTMSDASGLYYMRNRFYDSSIGRFTSPDPIQMAADNSYHYVGDNPLQYLDPLGTKKIPVPPRDLPRDQQRPFPPPDPELEPPQDPVLITGAGDSGPDGGGGDSGGDGGTDNQPPCNNCSNPKPGPPGGGGTGGSSKPINAVDPNQKIGPSGFADPAFVASGVLLPYRVDFENDAEATAPAQRVDIVDQLSEKVDWDSLQFTEVGFGDTIIVIPPGRQHFQTSVGMNYNSQDFDVDIQLAFHSETGRIHVSFQSLDPKTSLPPDALTGFLPPEDESGRGMGYFSYTINAKPNLPTGTEIRNVALITFDRGETIATNQIDPHDPAQGTDPTKEALVTIDAGAPTSSVVKLSAKSVPSFVVNWAGTDDVGGAGVASYDIFVSVNNGPYRLWLDDTQTTSAIYLGEPGQKLAFYSQASDHVGHQEAAPTTADSTTEVAEAFDFGDARSPYPVTLSQDGARHTIGTLFLGTGVDGETDGTASLNADSDERDDGLVAVSTILTTNVATKSSFSVVASQSGKLDGWIDFNGDGDWLDAGEKVFLSTSVISGTNLLSFSIPADAKDGLRAARFRISAGGGLAPTGLSVDGEVEDYSMSLVKGSNTAKLEIAALAGETKFSVAGSDLEVHNGDALLFKGPMASVGEVDLNGGAPDDVLKMNISPSLANKNFVIDGGDGKDRLELSQSGHTLDITGTRVTVRDLETIDVRGTGANTFVASLEKVKAISSTSDTLEVVSDNDDTITFGAGWRAEMPRILNGQFTHIIGEAVEGGTGRIELRNNRFMQNPLNRFDVDRDGFIRPIDALQVMNAIRRRGNGPFVLPTSDDKISRFYFDVSGTNDLTPIEALFVMNAIRRRVPGTGESPIANTSTSPSVVDLAKDPAPDSLPVIDIAPRLQQTLSSLVETRSEIPDEAPSNPVGTVASIARQPFMGKSMTLAQPSRPQTTVEIEAADEWFAEFGQEDGVQKRFGSFQQN